MDLKQNKTSRSDTRAWWVVFRPAKSRILRALTKTGFGHCYVFTRMNDVVLGIDPMMGTVNHIITNSNFADMLAAQKECGYRVVVIHHQAEPESFRMRPPLMTCASYIAYTIGIGFFGTTPYGLYKKLMKMGAEEI